MVGTGKGVPRVRYAEQNSAELDEKTIGISAHGSVYGGEGAFDGRAKKSSPKNWHPVDTGAKLFDVLRSNSSKDGPCCSCVKNLQIHSHANGSGISMRWDSGMFV